MKTTRHHLAQIIAEQTMHISNTKKLANELAAYLLDENITASIEPLMRDIMQYRAEHGVIEATAVSAHNLGTHVTADIKQILKDEYGKKTKVVILKRDDASVVGGVKVEMPNEQLDMTVRSKLNTFKRLAVAGKE